ncbi:MAG: zinc-dependent metalloprotease [Actinomycetota bacterium]
MSTPGFPFGMDPESLRDAPLFRELQRVMSSSSGPVQWELARQVAVAGAAEAATDATPDDATRQAFEEIARVAELQVLGLTELTTPNEVMHVDVVRRVDWIAAAMDEYRPLVERAAQRMSDALGVALTEQLPIKDAGEGGGMAALGFGSPKALIGQLGPLLQATQVGQVFGFLATRVFGGHDVGVPRVATGPVRFVLANIEAFERDWSLDPREFRTFVAMHQVVHRLQSAQPWLPAHAAAVIDDFCSTMTIDVEAIRDRFASISPEDPEALSAAFADEEGSMFGIVLDDEQRIKLDRVRALIGAVEGYGDHVATTIGRRLLASFPQIEEAMRRHREDEELDPIFARLLGVDVGREHVAAGRAFCETVVEMTDEATLSRMWDSSDALPGLAELREPRLWLARTV